MVPWRGACEVSFGAVLMKLGHVLGEGTKAERNSARTWRCGMANYVLGNGLHGASRAQAARSGVHRTLGAL